MQMIRPALTMAAVLCASAAFSASAQAQSIKVSNLKPTGQVPSGGTVTVTADVVVTGLPDGMYPVTGSLTNDDTSNTTSFTGNVTITNGKGSVSIANVGVPAGHSGDTGTIAIQVTDMNSGVSGAEDGDIN